MHVYMNTRREQAGLWHHEPLHEISTDKSLSEPHLSVAQKIESQTTVCTRSVGCARKKRRVCRHTQPPHPLE